MPRTQKSKPYFGSPINHPDQQHVGNWTGKLREQHDDITQGFSMIRTGFSPSKTTLPITMQLKLGNDMVVGGTMIDESLSLTPTDGRIRFILAEWDENILRFSFVEIDRQDNISVEVRVNPPDPHRAMNIPTRRT